MSSLGRMAVVDGRLQVQGWTDKEGSKHQRTVVVAENVYFGDSKREEKDSALPSEEQFEELSGDVGELPL